MERGWRWAKRNPRVAGLSTAVLALMFVLAIGGPVAAMVYNAQKRAETRARAAEFACSALERQAMLGRYMLEMRHNLNNALTSVLGNSDLLLLEPGSFSSGAGRSPPSV